MPLLTIALILIVVGVLLYLVNKHIPMDPKIKQILNIVVVIVIILWLVTLFVDIHSLKSIRVGK